MVSFAKSDLPLQFCESDYDTQCKIIQMGTSLYYNGNKWIYSQMHESTIDEYKIKMSTMSSSHLDELQTLKTTYNEKLAQHALLIDEKYQLTMSSKDELLRNYISEITSLKTRCQTLEAQNLEALSIGSKIDSLIGKKSTVDNITKGNFGESVVWNQITHYYPSSILEDCSDEAGHGDMLWIIQSFKALVEVKNVQHVRPSEVQKFERDLLQNSNNANANAGIFISLKTETIPGKGTLYFEFFNNVPVIYVSNVYENLNNLKIAMEILYNIQTTLGTSVNEKKDESTHSMQYIQKTVNDFVQLMFQKQKTHLQNIQKMKASYETLGQCIVNEEKMINESLAIIETLKQALDWIVYNEAVEQNTTAGISQKELRKQEAIHFFAEFYRMNNRWPGTTDIPDYKSSIYRGEMSIANLKNEAQNLT
jgi:hypothetical protein